MPTMVDVKKAAAATGLSEWELKRGVREGIYPYIRIGEGRGKFLFNIDQLNDVIKRRALANASDTEATASVIPFGIRKIEG